MKSNSVRLIVVGMNPGRTRGNRSGSPSLRRLNLWMDHLKVRTYSFINSTQHQKPSLANLDLNTLVLTRDYDKVIALGGFASRALGHLSVKHFALPHPSPLNRKLNDPKFEAETLEKCYNYLHA